MEKLTLVIHLAIIQEQTFQQVGTTENNPDLYSVVDDGEVVYVRNDVQGQGGSVALGNQVQIKDNRTGYYYRYCHLLYNSIQVQVGDRVNRFTKLGKMGNTGNSTGTHLHLELTPTISWSNFLDPVTPLGIPNVRGTIVEYDNTNPPSPTRKKKYKTPIFRIRRINLKLK